MTTTDITAGVPLVIDNGSGVCKAGNSGEEKPRCIFPEIIGRPRVKNVIVGFDSKEVYVGEEALQKRGILKLSYPIEHGIIVNDIDMKLIWSYIFSKQLRVKPSDHPVLLTEAPLNPLKNREMMVKTMFEEHNVPKLYIGIQAVLALYASGRTTGLILDSGDGVTHAVPIFEGYCLDHAITKVMIAGRDISTQLSKQITSLNFHAEPSAKNDIAREIKEKMCYVAANFEEEEKKPIEQITKGYILPDGKVINVGRERYRCAEALFNPGKIMGSDKKSATQLVSDCIKECDIDIRTSLRENIILSGGTTSFPGYPERLQRELQDEAPDTKTETGASLVNIKVVASPDRKFMVWQGGAVVTSFSSFNEKWITKEEYQEYGTNLPTLLKKMA